MKSLNRLTAEQAALEENFVGTFEDCVAHVKSIGQGAGYAKYWKHWDATNRRWVGKCQSWVVRNCVAPKVAPSNCPSVENDDDTPMVTAASAPVTTPVVTTAPPATIDSDVHCIRADGSEFVNQCVLDMFAADPNQNICGPCGCSGCPLIKPAEECIVERVGGGVCPQMTLKSLGRLTAEQAALEENFTGTFEDCVAHVESLLRQGAGYAKYWKHWDNANRRWVGKCQSWVVRNCVAPKVAPSTCPSVDDDTTVVTAASAPVSTPTPQTDSDVHCIRADGSRFVNECVLDMFGADPNQNICGPCGCSGCPLIKPAEECIVERVGGDQCAQMTVKSRGRLTAEQAALEENFTGTFEDCVAHVESLFNRGAGYAKYWKHWDNANRRWMGKCQSWAVRNCIAPKVAPSTCPSVDDTTVTTAGSGTPAGSGSLPQGALDDAQECVVRRVGEACPQFTLKAMNRLTAEEAALEEDFDGSFEDCVAHVVSLFRQGAGYAKYWTDSATGVVKCQSWVVRNCVAPKVAPATCPEITSQLAPPSMPPTTSAVEVPVEPEESCKNKIVATSGRTATLVDYSDLAVGSKVWHDRSFTFKSIGAYSDDCQFMMVSNNDKNTPFDDVEFEITLGCASTIYLDFWGGDEHANVLGFSTWNAGWERADMPSAQNSASNVEGLVFKRSFPAGTASLMGNGGTMPGTRFEGSVGHGTYYGFICPAGDMNQDAVEVPFTPEEPCENKIAATSGRSATLVDYSDLSVGGQVWHDRSFTFKSIGAYSDDCEFMMVSNNDKNTPFDDVEFEVTLVRESTIYLDFWGGDEHANVLGFTKWNAGWERSAMPSAQNSASNEQGLVFERTFSAGTVGLMGNGGQMPGTRFEGSVGHGTYYGFICPAGDDLDQDAYELLKSVQDDARELKSAETPEERAQKQQWIEAIKGIRKSMKQLKKRVNGNSH